MKQTLHIYAKKRIASWLFMVITMMLFGGGEAYAQSSPKELNDIKAKYAIFQNHYDVDHVRDCDYSKGNGNWTILIKNTPINPTTLDPIDFGAKKDRYLQFDLDNYSGRPGDYGNTTDNIYLWENNKQYVITLKLYEKGGQQVGPVMSRWGTIQEITNEGVFYKQHGQTGTLFTTEIRKAGDTFTYSPDNATSLAELKAADKVKTTWLFDAGKLTNENDNEIVLHNVTADATKTLTIGDNSQVDNPINTIDKLDLTGSISDSNGQAYTIGAIAEGAFSKYKENLKTLVLPKTIISIGYEAFNGAGLTSIHLEGEILMSDTYGTAFDGLKDGKQSCNVFVPTGTVEDYYYNDDDPNNDTDDTFTSWMGFHYIFEEGTKPEEQTTTVEFSVEDKLKGIITVSSFGKGKYPERVKNDRDLWVEINASADYKGKLDITGKAYDAKGNQIAGEYITPRSIRYSIGNDRNTNVARIEINIKEVTPPGPINNTNAQGKDITIISDTKYTNGDGTEYEFNGSINGATLKSLTIDPSSTDNLNINLIGVTVKDGENPGNTTIKKDVTMTLSGENNLGNLVNDGKLTFEIGNELKLTGTTITNNGTFIDNTGLVKEVKGDADLALRFTKYTDIAPGTGVTADATTVNGQTPVITWKKLTGGQVSTDKTITVTGDGFYDCTATVSNQGNTVSTTLTATIYVTVKDPGSITNESDGVKNKDITIISSSEYKNDDTDTKYFNSKIEGATVNNLGIDTKNATQLSIRLKNVTVTEATTIEPSTNIKMVLSGNNNLGTLENNGTLTLAYGVEPTLKEPNITNNGTFTDNSGLVTKVSGVAGMHINELEDVNGVPGSGEPVTLKITFKDMDGNDIEAPEGITYKWYKKTNTGPQEVGSDMSELDINETDFTDTKIPVAYYCEVTRKVQDKGKDVTTMLTVNSIVSFIDQTPDPSTYYDIVLPEIEGVITNPVAGTYSVEENESFWFTITLADDYNQSKPIVKVGDKEIKPDGFGRYVIDYLYDNTEIKITGVEKNPAPVGIDGANGTTVKVWAANGTLHIFTPRTADIRIVDFSGSPVKTIKSTSGDNQIKLPNGNYIVIIGNETFKIAL